MMRLPCHMWFPALRCLWALLYQRIVNRIHPLRQPPLQIVACRTMFGVVVKIPQFLGILFQVEQLVRLAILLVLAHEMPAFGADGTHVGVEAVVRIVLSKDGIAPADVL